MNNHFFTSFFDAALAIFKPERILLSIIVLIGAWLAQRILVGIGERVIRNSIRGHHFKSEKDEIQREDTIISIFKTGLKGTIWIIAALTILGTFNINLGPLIAGAGVVGVALGFGAQSMVKDFLAGFFVIAENQYRVGDVLEINQTVSGVVEQISLRQTVLRDLEGVVHHIPNGNIQIASNLTLDYAQVDLNIGVGYQSDIDEVEKLINQVGKEIAADEKFKRIVIEPATMLRVEAFAESSITIKIVCKTLPMYQWDVKGELLRRLKKSFETNGVEIPFPQRVLHEATSSKHR